ncbi:hypothetical protein GCM10011450_15770 [Advenella faeciporci]|uniref:Uncharacterized protein n=1 Tax=Advenella faeciporci TaxID=797535 RepID=A0A918MZS4_9BURK|nr:hypothetical protein [Advenella faeciporci]GGW86696.1 hypothetical protein GCM10011450_15770 [Advenella faeciporci]
MEYFSEILAFITGLASGWVLKVTIDKSRNSTAINNNNVGGDIAGRDIIKKK